MTTDGPVMQSVAAVVDSKDRIRGTAFWVTDRIAVTCAHVVEYCGDGPITLAPAAMRGVTIPVEDRELDEELDLAVLRTAAVPSPIRALPVSTIAGEGATITSHGYPYDVSRAQYPTGFPMEPGTMAGELDVQTRRATQRAFAISKTKPGRGQSGGPAFDTDSDRVIGVLYLVDDKVTEAGTTFAIPVRTLVERWPEIPVDDAPTFAPISPVGLRPRRNPIREGSEARLADRDKELAEIAEALAREPSATLVAEPTRATLQGSPGIGKSALALEYAYQHADDYSAIWWIDASNELTTAASFRQFAQAVDIPVEGVEDPVIRDQVVDHLHRRTNWLAIFDNAESRNDVDQWLPTLGHGHILITSRSPTGWAQTIHVKKLSQESMTQWLLDATNPAGAEPSDTQVTAAQSLAEAFDGLALAGAQALAFIDATGMALSTYAERYATESRQLLADSTLPPDRKNPVAVTISLATDRLTSDGHPHAVRLLDLVAYMAPDRIPQFLFTPESIGATTKTEIDIAVSRLRNFGLIETVDELLNVHRLTQDVTRSNHQTTST